MERKIGEIFEYNGEWHQCVEQPEKYDKTVCNLCDFHGIGNCELDRCSGTYRSDKKSVIFKKLEKVGKPYGNNGKLVQNYKLYIPVYGINEDEINSIIPIEIKQNKEDMGDLDKIKVRDYTKVEELNVMKKKKQQADKLVTDYTANKITYKEFEKSIIELYADKHTEEKKLNLKEFDLEAAKAGKPVCTRDGRKARIICFDAKDTQPIIGLYEKNIDGIVREYLCSYHTDGRMYDDQDTGYDLMMLPEKKEGWANIYYEHDAPSHREASWVYDKEEEAIKVGKEHGSCYIATVRIEWEE